jgi:hypothetical protein
MKVMEACDYVFANPRLNFFLNHASKLMYITFPITYVHNFLRDNFSHTIIQIQWSEKK